MCGIVGCFAKKITDKQKQLINGVLKYQYSRGPEHTEQCRITNVNFEGILGHNRLKIIDLSQHANQPMWDTTNNYCITFNGEIYNYLELKQELLHLGFEFKTKSDTEVILNAFKSLGN